MTGKIMRKLFLSIAVILAAVLMVIPAIAPDGAFAQEAAAQESGKVSSKAYEVPNVGTVTVNIGNGNILLDPERDEAVFACMYEMAEEGSILMADWRQGYDLDMDGNVDVAYTAYSTGEAEWHAYRETNLSGQYELIITDTVRNKRISEDKVYCTKIIWNFEKVPEYNLSICSYDATEEWAGKGGQFTSDVNWFDYKQRYFHGGNNYGGIIQGKRIRVYACPDNGYDFVGWYKAEYVGEGFGQYQACVPHVTEKDLLSTYPQYTFNISEDTVICPVFRKADLVNFVDIGNIWISLDPLNEVPFTTELNPDVAGLEDFVEIGEQKWTRVVTPGDPEGEIPDITGDTPGVPVLGATYRFSVEFKAKGDYRIEPERVIRFVYGGTEFDMDGLDITYSDDFKSIVVSGFVPEVTVSPVSISGGISGARIGGIKDKTYNGRAQAQTLDVTINVNGTVWPMAEGIDYDIIYMKDGSEIDSALVKNAGSYAVAIQGKGKYTGQKQAISGFEIKKAKNTLKTTGKTVTVGFAKVKKKAQTIKRTKAVTVKNPVGKVTYKLKSVTKSKFKKYFKVSSAGKITVKKGLPKGTYKVKISVTAAGNANYLKGTKSATVTVKVK